MEQSKYGSPLNKGVIVPEGLPPAYGSAQDPRYIGVTDLHTLPEQEPVTEDTAEEVETEYIEIRPASEAPRYAPVKQLFHFGTAIDIDANIDIPFKAQTIRFDNYSVRWVYVVQLRRWIPPMWFGSVLNGTGLSSITLLWQSPPGIVQPAPVANQIVTGIAYLDRLPEVAGNRV